MVAFGKKFNALAPFRVLVVGDLMVDAYTFGKARRISPEAPVPVIHVQREESRPGGAGNVVLNLISMGAKVSVLGRIGEDATGEKLAQQFLDEDVNVEGLYVEKGYATPIKNRIIADTQQVIRIDHETTDPLHQELEAILIQAIPKFLEHIDVVAISDYGKGFLSEKLLSALLAESAKKGIPTIIDPKGIEFRKYRGTTWLKPNLSEAYAAAKLPLKASLEEVAKELYAQTQAEWLMITRSEAGISLFHKGESRQDFPVAVKAIKDVTGAGDTVLAMLTTAVANRLTPEEGAYFCNISAGIAIERIGCARVSLKELAQRLLEQNVSHKIYEHEEQIDILEDLLKHGGYQLLKVPSSNGLTSTVFREIRRMRHEHPSPLLVHVENPKQDDEMVNILADLHEVDFVIAKPAGLERLMRKTPPVRTHELS
jgi:D-beta-D-heptose 7-phosphate kinase/D-beta-D-heptose 1-phosphate adenosyltransferase